MSVQNLHDRERHERSLELAAVAVDFDLTSAETRELEAHLAGCSTCARRAAALRADASTLRAPLMLLPSARVDAAVHAAIVHQRARPQRLLLVAAAVLVLLALLGAAAVGAYLIRSWQILPTTVVPSPTVPAAIATPGPDATPVAGGTWRSLGFVQGSSSGFMEAAAFAGTELVGVGRGGCVPTSGVPSHCYVGAWTAADGEAWVRTVDQAGLEIGTGVGTSGPEAGIFDVAAGPAGIVGIGYGDDGRPAIWRSADGRTWQRVTFDVLTSPLGSRVAAIAPSQHGYVLVGWIVDGETLRARAAAWTSSDGVIWTRAEDNAAMDVGPCLDTGEEPVCGGMLGVVATTTGLVAVGNSRTSTTGPGRPAAWASPDGVTWTRSATGLDFDGSLSGIAVGGPGLVAVGTICRPDCQQLASGGGVATSVDGSTWTHGSVAGAVPLQHVVANSDGVFALGVLNQDVDPRAELQLWHSDDAVSWQRVTGLPQAPDGTWHYGGADIAAAPDRLTIVGWTWVTGADAQQDFSYSNAAILPAGTPGLSPSATTTSSPAATLAASGVPCDTISPIRVDRLLQAGRACFGAADVRVVGWLGPSWGIGGTNTGIEPTWLGEPLTDPVLWLKPRNPDGCFTTDDCVWTFVHIRPGSAVPFQLPERWVEVTGHFDDPVAQTCLWDGHSNDPITPARAVETCRDAFVVTAVRDAAQP
jgi:hypothetical protein